MFNKLLIGVCVVLLPVAVISSFSLGKAKIPHPKPSAYDTLVDQPVATIPDPLNPNSRAEIIIDAPKEAKIGELVRFDLSKSSGTMFKWCLVPVSKNFEIFEGGRKAVFSADIPGDYTFIVAAALNNTVDVKTHIVKVGNGTVTPPTPTPIPTPGPNSTLNAKVKGWADAINSQTKKIDAGKLAGGFDSVAAMIAGGGLTTPEEVIAKTAETNRATLGIQLAAWVPFLTNLQTEMKARADSGTLTTVQQHADLWREIAKALKEYSAS